MVECFPYMEEVGSSSLSAPTIFRNYEEDKGHKETNLDY